MKIMGWRPPQRPAWLKAYMKMPGPIRAQLLLLTTLTISSVSSTALQISNRVGNTSDVNTFPNVVSLEVVREGLRLRVTGKSTMEALTNLRQIESYLGTPASREKSSPSIPPKDK